MRRYEGDRLNPTIDDKGVRWFDEKEVAALAAELVNKTGGKQSNVATAPAPATDQRSPGEIAALVFERLEQRQSLPEIVIGLRIEPDKVRALFDQWCLGLTEGQLRMKREPRIPRANEIEPATPDKLATRLAAIPQGTLTRISVARFRDIYDYDVHAYAVVNELGGFHVSGPCGIEEITRRFGPGTYRVTAYGFDPSAVMWELMVRDLEPS